jgi:hypothetical protein
MVQMREIDWVVEDDRALTQAAWGTVAAIVFGSIYCQVHRTGLAAADELARASLKALLANVEQAEQAHPETD